MPFCAKCGTQVPGSFCPNCGTPVAGAAPQQGGFAPPPPQASAGDAGLTEPVAGALCYLLGVITGVIFLVIEPYSRNRNVRFHAFQSIFTNLGMIVGWIILTIVGIALNVIPVLGTILMVVLWFAYMVCTFGLWVYLLVKTFNGQKVVLPVVGPMAEKQASA